MKSGNDTEYRGEPVLLGGRAYPLRLEFSKAKQGVEDSRRRNRRSRRRSRWSGSRRNGAAEVIPTRNLSPNRSPETLVIETPFPPDDRSLGWERGTSVSKAWDQATTDAALETAGYVAAHLAELAGVSDECLGPQRKLRDFCRRFAERAFRRPLTDEQKASLHRPPVRRGPRSGDGRQARRAARPEVAALPVPRGRRRRDAYDVASRLSFGLWDSLPDQELLDAAAAGQLATREQVARQAERMLADPRAQAKLREFFLQWLKVDQAPDLAKDRQRFPGFDPAIAADLRTSLDLFLDDVIWNGDSDFRQLFLAD